jgi:Tfp pilus assembly protein PilO
MRLSPRDQDIVGAVLIVLFAGAFFMLLIQPRFDEVSDLEAELETIEQDKLTAEALLARRQEAKNAAAETQVRLLDIASGFPESPELPALIIELQDRANAVEIDFIQVSPGMPGAHGSLEVSVMPINVTIAGTWRQLIDYVEQLADLRREVRITNFAIGAVPPEAEDAEADATETVDPEDEIYTVSVQVSLEVYMMPAELFAVPADVPDVPDAPE